MVLLGGSLALLGPCWPRLPSPRSSRTYTSEGPSPGLRQLDGSYLPVSGNRILLGLPTACSFPRESLLHNAKLEPRPAPSRPHLSSAGPSASFWSILGPCLLPHVAALAQSPLSRRASDLQQCPQGQPPPSTWLSFRSLLPSLLPPAPLHLILSPLSWALSPCPGHTHHSVASGLNTLPALLTS